MELKDFVAESIKQIIDGINEAKTYGEANGARINPHHQIHNSHNANSRRDRTTGETIETIDFDVAVTVTEGTQTKGGIGVFTGFAGLGSQGQSEAANSSVSRLRFTVPIVFPVTPNS